MAEQLFFTDGRQYVWLPKLAADSYKRRNVGECPYNKAITKDLMSD